MLLVTEVGRDAAGGVKQASHLLKYDSTLGTFNADVKVVDDSTIAVNGKPIKIVSSRDPLALPWKENNIDLVIEGTGVFVSSEGAGKHIQVWPSLGDLSPPRSNIACISLEGTLLAWCEVDFFGS